MSNKPPRSRIVGFDPAVPADQLLAHPLNPKNHPAKQRETMRCLPAEAGKEAGIGYPG